MSTAPLDSQDRASRVDSIVASAIANLANGEPFDSRAIAAAHPELMPELMTRLQQLELIQQAQKKAAESEHLCGDGESNDSVAETSPSIASEFEDLAHDGFENEIVDIQVTGYTLIRRLGTGGQGCVYLAVQDRTLSNVAIKVLEETALESHEKRERFAREIKILGQLHHPNIVTILDAGITKQGQQFYAMEYIDGKTVTQYVQETRPTIEKALELFAEVCDAIGFAHEKGIIHRDLKPGNLMVDSKGRPRILDFGFAKRLAASEEAQMSVRMPAGGTWAYMSPEQVNNEVIGARSDIYSLGVMLYQVLTGADPYKMRGPVPDIIENILKKEPVSPNQAWSSARGLTHRTKWRYGRRSIEPEICTIILQTLAKVPERRMYRNAADLGEDLRRYLSGKTISAKRDETLYLIRKLLSRHRYVTLLLASFICAGSSLWLVRYYARKWEQSAARNIELGAQFGETERKSDYEVKSVLRDRTIFKFLYVWSFGGEQFGKELINIVPEGSKERAVFEFLLNDDVSPQQLLRQIPAESHDLAFLVIGERFARQGRIDEARTSLEKGLDTVPHTGYHSIIKARLDKLAPSRKESGWLNWPRRESLPGPVDAHPQQSCTPSHKASCLHDA